MPEEKIDKRPELLMIETAEHAAALMEQQNNRMEELMKKNEAMLTRNILAGKSEGVAPTVEKKEETPSEYVKRIMKGKA